ncbi:MAG TPA: TraB/GumN family protein, partial [Bacteroidales bacterium]|nr:TraB/GumN family protein [Bacteroidales bacterium]
MKKAILFTLALFAAVVVNAQTSVWKVTGKGTNMYLGGTVHLLRASDFPLPAPFDSAYAHSAAIVLETNADELQRPEVAQKMMQKMMLTDGKTLKTVLSDTSYKALEKLCAGMGLPIANLATLKPSMVILVA